MNLRASAVFFLLAAAVPALAAQDVITVGTVNATAKTVTVPVSIRDVAGTPLGKDRAPASHIQSFSIRVTYAPASAVAAVTFSRAGVTASLTPTSEFTPKTPGTASLLDTFQQSTNPIPLTLNAAAPGDKVAQLVFTLSDSATPGTKITLVLDPSLTQLTDEGGTAATKQTVANGTLALVDGAINVVQPPLTLSLTPASRTLEVSGSVTLTVSASATVAAPTSVTLTSSSSSVSVPSSVVIAAGAQQASFTATAVAEGNATITASLPAAAGGASATASISVRTTASCPTPAVPQPGGPASARTGETYTIVWPAVANATDYVIEEASSATFSGAASSIRTAPSASYTHSAGTFYYRLRARNRANGCDTTSGYSPVVIVTVSDQPVAAMRVVPVVGSTRGEAGSFFKTSVQLYNPTSATLSGRIVYHPQGAPGSAGDPALAYAIAPGKTLSYDDLLPAMGIASGIGSADIVADIVGGASLPVPVATFRIYNDAGAGGTTGLVQEPLRPEDALSAGDTGVLIAPPNMQKFRLNVGLRSLEEGAEVAIAVRDADGVVVATAVKAYDPVYFRQVGSTQFLDGYVLQGGETVSVSVTRGRAIVYGAITDNITNDPSQQFARRAN